MEKILALFFLSILLPLSGLACSCVGNESVKTALKGADAVLIGRVIKSEKIEIPTEYSNLKIYIVKNTIAITKVYKGEIQSKNIEVVSGEGGGDCGFRFTKGKDYIIYGYWSTKYLSDGNEVAPYLTTDICTRTTTFNRKEKLKLTFAKK